MRLWLRILLACLVPLAAMAPAASLWAQDAQVVTAPDYVAWEQVAKRAQEAVDAARASSVALEDLRKQIVVWRDKFQAAQEINKPAIQTLQAQLDALGPPPKDGAVEEASIAAQRADLNARLSEMMAPVTRAQVAYSRANSLIGGIDKIIRERQANALLELDPSPLNPVHWPKGLEVLTGSANSIVKEFTTAWASPIQRAGFKKNLPGTLVFLVLALLLLVRGRHWMVQLTDRVLAQSRTAGRWMLGFVTSIGQIVVPFLGVLALTRAFYATGLVGLRSDIVLASLPSMGLAFFVARWLGARVFPRNESVVAPLNLTPVQRRDGRLYSASLGLFLGLAILEQAMAQFDDWPIEAQVVVLFPILALSGVVLFRLGRLLLAHVAADREKDQEGSYRNQIIQLLGRALIAVAIVGPTAAAIGYFKAAQFLMFPTIRSLAVLSFLLVLQRVIAEIYAFLTGSKEGAQESLVPVLLGFMLTLASAPLFALIWGARVADLTELWTRFQEGFDLGGTKISPTSFLTFAVVFALGYMLTRVIQGALKTTILPKTKIDVGGRNAIVSGLGYLGIFLATVVAITAAGIDLSSLAIVAGALSVGIGFGLQNIVSNFVSGIILLIERPISEGDWIEVGDKMGYVRDISVRSTRIETFDRTDVIIPNTDLVSGTVTNWTRGNSVGRAIIPVGVAYGTDTRKVETILREIALAHPMVLANPAPGIVFYGFGADSLDFQIRAILRDVNWVLSVKSDIRHEIIRRFSEEGIEIPFAQRDLWLRNPETLRPLERAAGKDGTSQAIPPLPGATQEGATARRAGNRDAESPDIDAGGIGDGDGDD